MFRILNMTMLMLALLISVAHAQRNQNRDNPNREDAFALVPLGDRVVDFGRDHDVIEINFPREFYIGRMFRALQFYVSRNDIFLDRIQVSYFEGRPEEFRIQQNISRGQQIQVDLNGDKSYMRRIDLWYRSLNGSPGQAHVRVWGEPTRRIPDIRPQPVDREVMVDLPCRDVDLFGADRDRIRLPGGRRFAAIELLVAKEGIRMFDVQVTDARGRTRVIPIRNNINANGTSGRLELGGREFETDSGRPGRGVNLVEIQMTYERRGRDSIQSGQTFLLPRVCVRGYELVREAER